MEPVGERHWVTNARGTLGLEGEQHLPIRPTFSRIPVTGVPLSQQCAASPGACGFVPLAVQCPVLRRSWGRAELPSSSSALSPRVPLLSGSFNELHW